MKYKILPGSNFETLDGYVSEYYIQAVIESND